MIWYGKSEVWSDVLERATGPTNRDATMAAVKQNKLITIGRPVDWTKSPEAYSDYQDFRSMPSTGGQWIEGRASTDMTCRS